MDNLWSLRMKLYKVWITCHLSLWARIQTLTLLRRIARILPVIYYSWIDSTRKECLRVLGHTIIIRYCSKMNVNKGAYWCPYIKNKEKTNYNPCKFLILPVLYRIKSPSQVKKAWMKTIYHRLTCHQKKLKSIFNQKYNQTKRWSVRESKFLVRGIRSSNHKVSVIWKILSRSLKTEITTLKWKLFISQLKNSNKLGLQVIYFHRLKTPIKSRGRNQHLNL